jgi:Domain of unknown function (DUF6438)
MRVNLILIMVFICVFAGCKNFAPQIGANNRTTPSPVQQKTDPNSALELTLERTACYGICPVYTVKVLSDGKIVFDGEKNTGVKGEATDTLSKEKKAQLIEAIDAADVFSLNNSYMGSEDDCPARATDAPSVNLTVKLNGKEKSIKHYWGCVEEKDYKVHPASLYTLENKIDEILDTKRWIKSDN